jgi:hypothetical protein
MTAHVAPLRLVRVICDGPRPFVAVFETDRVVRRCAPILANHLAGKSDDEARAIIARMGWRASVVAPPLRVLVCGGRDYGDHEALFAALDAIHASIPIEVIIHGGAPGADYLASFWAAARAVNERRFPADWPRFGRAAGPIRNAHMLREARPDLVVAAPGGRGTADMVRQAGDAGVPVREVGSP